MAFIFLRSKKINADKRFGKKGELCWEQSNKKTGAAKPKILQHLLGI